MKKILWGLYIIILLAVGVQLFFEDQVNAFFASANVFKHSITNAANKPLTIAYALAPHSFEPTLFDEVDRSRLVDVYEGLVRTDRDLKIQPALAISWGLLDQNTWEFKLRPNVRFHNGQSLTPDDVVFSIKRAMNFKNSQLKNLLNTISDIKIVDEHTLHIITKQPSPLLLSALAVTFIVPKDQQDFEKPVGTGPYTFVSNQNNTVTLKRFDGYWGPKPFYPEVILRTVESRLERQHLLQNGDIQILADVPPAATKDLQSADIEVTSIPSLEVNFLMFNLTDPFLMNLEVRQALSHAFDPTVFVKIANGFARPVGQFVSSGVFGFNPAIPLSNFDLNKAKKMMVDFYGDQTDTFALTFDYPESLDLIGQYVEDQLNQLGIDVTLNPLPDAQLQEKIQTGSSQFYYLGWRSELGDSADFLASNVHSRDPKGRYGQFNGTYYFNDKVNGEIEQSERTLDEKKRLNFLQDAMKTIVQDDVVGIPLFESEKIFAFRKNIQFEPRVDGYLFASEIQ